MDENFWIEKWKKGKIPFHVDEVSPYLMKYFSLLSDQKDLLGVEHALVPLCGKTKDIIWLSDQGLKTTGVELSSQAIEQFFSENKLRFRNNINEKFDNYECLDKKIKMVLGNFFKLNSKDIGPIDFIYDYKAYLAIPKEMRKQYVSKLNVFLSAHGHILLLVFDFESEL